MRAPVFLVFVFLASCAHRTGPTRQRSVEAELVAFRKRIESIEANRDVSAYGALHAEDVVFDWQGVPTVRGRSALERLMRESWASRNGLQLTISASKTEIHGRSAYEFGSYRETWRGVDGKDIVETGRYVIAYALGSDGQWRIARMLGYTDPPH